MLDETRQQLQNHHELVLQAAPGAGKTTQVPLALLQQSWLEGRKILMLEPRRMAARAAAERMAELLGEKTGATVGYRIRQQTRVSAKTRIEVITEGVLTRLLQQDPALSGVGLVIFDEFHERNLNSDLGLALCLQAREIMRDEQPLRLLTMSATLDGLNLSTLLPDAPQIHSEGRAFPVALHYCGKVPAGSPIDQAVLAAISRALAETDGSILVFLPGQGEIQRIHQALKARIDAGICIFPLYGALPLSAQMAAIQPLSAEHPCQRKIVLATDIAETSITIEGISTVVDSGLSRQPGFDPATGMTRLHTRRISRASSIQRMGRAGRTRAGHCYRLWSESAQASLAPQTAPEIMQADLCPLALQLLQWGVSDPHELAWLDRPPQAAFDQALDLLRALGAIETAGESSLRLTAHGEQMARLPLHPRLAHMLMRAATRGQLPSASALAVLLSERDPLRQYGHDLASKVDVLLGDIPCERQYKKWWHSARQQMQSFERLCATHGNQQPALDERNVTGWLIAQAYPDRIARRRHADSRSWLLVNGRAARLPSDGRQQMSDWIAIAELGGLAGQREDTIFAAANIDEDMIHTEFGDLIEQQEVVDWDDDSGKMLAQQREYLGAILLHSERLPRLSTAVHQQAVLRRIERKGLPLLNWDVAATSLRNRVQCLREHEIDSGSNIDWPDMSDQGLLQTLSQWLLPFTEAVYSDQDFKTIDLHQCLLNLLPWPLPQKLDQLAPSRWRVPSGSNVVIDYSQSPPVLAVKLQEMFGCQQTPTIANGRIALLVHLLSPAQKPLQITQDLAGFWSGSYHAVKKEMKGRYPKHPWPDDPLQALPTRYTKHRRPRA